MEFRLRPRVSWSFLKNNTHHCYAKNSMKPRARSLNSMNYIFIYTYMKPGFGI